MLPLNARSYFQLSLLFPIAIPLLTMAVWPRGFAQSHSGLTGIFGLADLALLIAGIPYLLFAVALFLWIRRRSLHTIQVAAVIAPIIFCVPVWLFILCLGEVHSIGAAIFAFIFYSFWTLAIGYAYVLLTYGIYFLLRFLGVVRI